MNALIVFDSNYGNTAKAATILGRKLDARLMPVRSFKKTDLDRVDLLIVGSPINGWRPTEKIQQFLTALKKDELAGVNVSSFDTRVNVFFHGDAARTILGGLKKAGATIISEPKGFFVDGGEGPLSAGEEEKIEDWAASIKQAYGGP